MTTVYGESVICNRCGCSFVPKNLEELRRYYSGESCVHKHEESCKYVR
mgnify:CR=1 FL=1